MNNVLVKKLTETLRERDLYRGTLEQLYINKYIAKEVEYALEYQLNVVTDRICDLIWAIFAEYYSLDKCGNAVDFNTEYNELMVTENVVVSYINTYEDYCRDLYKPVPIFFIEELTDELNAGYDWIRENGNNVCIDIII